MKTYNLLVLAASSLALGGCVASMAANAVTMAVKASRPDRAGAGDLRGSATAACSERAAPLGTVKIIDAAQRPDGRVTVWGTVEAEGARQSFECKFGGKVTAFKLRRLP